LQLPSNYIAICGKWDGANDNVVKVLPKQTSQVLYN